MLILLIISLILSLVYFFLSYIFPFWIIFAIYLLLFRQFGLFLCRVIVYPGSFWLY